MTGPLPVRRLAWRLPVGAAAAAQADRPGDGVRRRRHGRARPDGDASGYHLVTGVREHDGPGLARQPGGAGGRRAGRAPMRLTDGLMLPAEAYTLARGARLGAAPPVRRDVDLPRPARRAGHPAGGRRRRRRGAAGARRRRGVRMFANTCRHRGHELLPEGGTSQRRSISCPYHAWTYDLGGSLIGRAGLPRRPDASSRRARPGRAAGAGAGRAGCSATRCTRSAATQVPSFDRAPRRPGRHARAVRLRRAGARRPAHLRGRGELEGDRGELPRVLPLPADPPRAVPGHARRTPATTTTCRVPGSAARWSCATGWRRCR